MTTRKRGGSRPIPILQRFEASYTPEPNTGCWLWHKSVLSRDGYGGIVFEGKKQSAHRVSFKLFNGPILDGLHVLHGCDTPSCVNPSHLRLGTHIENMNEMAAKGRANAPTGRKHYRWISDETRAQVVRLAKQKVLKREIAAMFGISLKTVCLMTPDVNGRDRYQAVAIRRGGA